MKKILLLIALFTGAGLSAQIQTYNYNASSGTISVGCTTGTNGVIYTPYSAIYAIWNVNIGQNKRVKIEYDVNLELYYDFVTIYSIDASGTSTLLCFELTGLKDGTIYSDFPTGKIQVVFQSDFTVACSTGIYTGFDIHFSPDDRPTFGLSIFSGPVEFDSSISGSSQWKSLRVQTLNGYLDVGPQLSTDANYFSFNKPLYLQTGVLSSSTGTSLNFQTGGSTA